ncbi:MAG: hypothetical protein A2Y10_00795 [Planctomycetes bacterium GWF2_41_51]|nr:MAG: hypothetical protein A2Y10_00795 [Planctomycetes bacterium GWF2_41_51]HBG26749.1 hypothetical protein [Phycisphaerales bacterium]
MEDKLLDCAEASYEVFDRFTFDYLFKKLLADGYDNEQAKDFIICNCKLSALVTQERLDNGYYKKINLADGTAPDLLELYQEAFIKMMSRN